jgi:hypothetical protein
MSNSCRNCKKLEAQREAEQVALKMKESNTRYYMMLMESPFAFR